VNGGKDSAGFDVPRPAVVRPVWPWILLVLSAGGIAALVFETRRVAEVAGAYEAAAREARRELAGESKKREAAETEAARLAQELAAASKRLQVMADAVEQRTVELTLAAEESEAAAERALEPMSEGVRLCLRTLHECLRAEGYASQRFVSARRLDDQGLHEVEMVDLDGDGLGTTFFRAGRMTAALDRGKGRLELRFFDGHRLIGGERAALPEDGWSIAFAPVDGRMFEERLPYLVHAEGQYPDADSRRDPNAVDAGIQRQWLERFDRLLEDAGTREQVQVARFRGMRGGWFLEADLIGTDSKHHVVFGAHAARLAVEVDAAAGVVSLLLQDGVLRNGAAESTISGDGYRMLLPRLSPKQAFDTMLGMVVTR
jgi:Sec-independent protein translocase protein TatA